jgi:ATP-dependent protease ClpP protease subunit
VQYLFFKHTPNLSRFLKRMIFLFLQRLTRESEGSAMEEDTKTTAPEGENDHQNTSSQRIVDFGSAVSRSKRGNIYTLTIVGQVEGHQVLPETAKSTKYEHVMPLLASLEQDEEIDGVLLLLNTVGGDIEAGLGIAELIAGMRKPTASLVLGGGHSIGVPLAVAPKVSMIVPSASMTIHPVRMNGTVIAAPQTFNYFERIQERIVSFVAKNSNISEKKFLNLMLKTGEMAADVGSVIYGEEAVNLGLIDRIGGLSDALESLYQQIAQARQEREKTLVQTR